MALVSLPIPNHEFPKGQLVHYSIRECMLRILALSRLLQRHCPPHHVRRKNNTFWKAQGCGLLSFAPKRGLERLTSRTCKCPALLRERKENRKKSFILVCPRPCNFPTAFDPGTFNSFHVMFSTPEDVHRQCTVRSHNWNPSRHLFLCYTKLIRFLDHPQKQPSL